MTNAFAAAIALMFAAQTSLPEPKPRRMPSPQSVVVDEGESVRASFVDGYGNQAGTVIFIRRPGEEPQVEFRTAGGQTLATIVPLATWERVHTASALFDRTLTPVAAAQGLSFCLHPWSVSMEAVDRARPGRPAAVRTGTQSGCNDGLVMPLAFQLAREAVAAFPSCALLEAEQYRNDVTRLAGCTVLQGDRAAAALARNVFGSDWFSSTRGDRTEYGIRHLFFDRVRLDWAGTIAEGSEAAAKLWSSRLEKASISPKRFVGETADRVRMEATVFRYAENRRYQAPVTIIWTRENGFGFRVHSATVGIEQSLK